MKQKSFRIASRTGPKHPPHHHNPCPVARTSCWNSICPSWRGRFRRCRGMLRVFWGWPWGCWLWGNGGWAHWWVGGKWKSVSKIQCSLESLVVGPCCWQDSGYPGCRASLPQMGNPQGFSFRGSLGRLEAQQLSIPWQTSTNSRVTM